ncbi:hypothetical protein PV326_000610 [Microctonus aethiopoides]|nr:hypothetical protein PV326_000610 [Microctonus aethiopoides]
MIVYVPGRMPDHVGPYGAARYPGLLGNTLPSYYHPISTYLNHQQQQHHHSTTRLFNENFNLLHHHPIDIPIWTTIMPSEEDLVASQNSNRLGGGIGASPSSGLPSDGPPSPSHSDSDASNSSLELGSIRRGENAQLKCRWHNCGRWFTSLEQLAGHVARLHAAPGPRGLFYCGWEGCARGERGFNARYKMLVHVRTHTNEKPHHCFQCDKSFSRAENLKIHARSHTGERPYVCPVVGCNKAYSNSSDRFKHTRTHAVDKPYCCKVPGCPKRYTDPSSLRKHVKTYRHYVNNNNDNKLIEKNFNVENNLGRNEFIEIEMEKRNSIESDKTNKDSSFDSSTTTTTTMSSTPPSNANSFEEQKKFVEWNNIYNINNGNINEQQQQQQQKKLLNEQLTPVKYSIANLSDVRYITPEKKIKNINETIFSGVGSKKKFDKVISPETSPNLLTIGNSQQRISCMQSTPIKMELDTKIGSVDYRNIDSIVNSTPCSNVVNNKNNINYMRNSVIKRANNLMDVDMNQKLFSTTPEIINKNNTGNNEENNDDSVILSCCCRHNKCCVHNNAKIISDLIMKTQNPLFKQLLGSVDIQYELQNIWNKNVIGERNADFSSGNGDNIAVEDLRIKNGDNMNNVDVTEMEQDLPLDLTIHK